MELKQKGAKLYEIKKRKYELSLIFRYRAVEAFQAKRTAKSELMSLNIQKTAIEDSRAFQFELNEANTKLQNAEIKQFEIEQKNRKNY